MTHRLHQTSLILSHKYIIHNILSDTAVTSITGLSFSDYWISYMYHSLICIDACIHNDNIVHVHIPNISTRIYMYAAMFLFTCVHVYTVTVHVCCNVPVHYTCRDRVD